MRYAHTPIYVHIKKMNAQHFTINHERYFERRRRNNLAAKKSRDQRKFREEAVAQRAEMCERENAMLRTQVG